MRSQEPRERLQETPPPRWMQKLLRSSGTRQLAQGKEKEALPTGPVEPARGNLEDFEAVRADEWLDGTVHHATPYGVFVDVCSGDGAEPARGLVYVTEMDKYPFDPERAFPPGRQVRVRVIDVDAAAEGTLLLSMRTNALDLRTDLMARRQTPEAEAGPVEVEVGLRVRNRLHQRAGQVAHTPWGGEKPIFLVRFDDGTVHARQLCKFVAEDGRPLAMRKYPSSVTGSSGSCWKCQGRSPLDEKAKNGHRYCWECWFDFLYD